MASKLKIYCAPMGFYDALIAAPNQKAALKAWGTTTDLFAAGRAALVEDPELQKLALAKPCEVVKHSRGDEADILQDIARTERRPAGGKGKAPPRQARRSAPPAPDRSRLDRAERELDEARSNLSSRLAEIERRRAELDKEERAVRLEQEARIADLERARDRERQAFERATRRAK